MHSAWNGGEFFHYTQRNRAFPKREFLAYWSARNGRNVSQRHATQKHLRQSKRAVDDAFGGRRRYPHHRLFPRLRPARQSDTIREKYLLASPVGGQSKYIGARRSLRRDQNQRRRRLFRGPGTAEHDPRATLRSREHGLRQRLLLEHHKRRNQSGGSIARRCARLR